MPYPAEDNSIFYQTYKPFYFLYINGYVLFNVMNTCTCCNLRLIKTYLNLFLDGVITWFTECGAGVKPLINLRQLKCRNVLNELQYAFSTISS